MATTTTNRFRLPPADRAAVYVSELVTTLDKRTKNYRKAVEAQRLIFEILRSEREAEEGDE